MGSVCWDTSNNDNSMVILSDLPWRVIVHCLGWYFNDPCFFSLPGENRSGGFFFNKTERGKKTDRKKMPGVKKKWRRSCWAKWSWWFRKSMVTSFRKVFGYPFKKKSFWTGKRYRCVFVSSRHQPILQEKKMAENQFLGRWLEKLQSWGGTKKKIPSS